MRSQYSAISNGSECSFLSISSDVESSYDDEHELMRACTDSKQENVNINIIKHNAYKRNKKETTFKKKKKHKGKFGVRRGRNGGNNRNTRNLNDMITPGPDDMHVTDLVYRKPPKRIISNTSVLLAPLGPLTSGKEQNKQKKKKSNVEIVDTHIVDDKHNQDAFFMNSNYDDISTDYNTDDSENDTNEGKKSEFTPMNTVQPNKTC
eukprot:399786_1